LEGIGGHHLYGVLERTGNLPIGMAEGTVLLETKKKDQTITRDVVESPKNDRRLDLGKEQTESEA